MGPLLKHLNKLIQQGSGRPLSYGSHDPSVPPPVSPPDMHNPAARVTRPVGPQFRQDELDLIDALKSQHTPSPEPIMPSLLDDPEIMKMLEQQIMNRPAYAEPSRNRLKNQRFRNLLRFEPIPSPDGFQRQQLLH